MSLTTEFYNQYRIPITYYVIAYSTSSILPQKAPEKPEPFLLCFIIWHLPHLTPYIIVILNQQTDFNYLISVVIQSIRLYWLNNTAATSETVDIILIRISRDGPTVSLSGSPTVSPTTAAS